MAKRLLFSFRFAFKNIIRFKIRSLLIILSFVALFVSFLLSLSIKGFLHSYYYDELDDRYRTIDFSMKTNLNSNLRYFSIIHLEQSTQLDNYIETYYPFFEIETIIEIDEMHKTYVKTMSSSIEHLIPVSNLDSSLDLTLTDSQVIITKSFADQYGLAIGDNLLLQIGAAEKSYEIVEIVIDGGLFQGDTVFINKSSSISLFLTALSPSLGSLPPSLLVNIYNRVYFGVAENVSTSDAMSFIDSIPAYESYDIQEVINKTQINMILRQNTVILELVLFIVVISILLVMHTTFLLYYDEKRKSFAVINMLGGKRYFPISIILIELSIFFVLALFPSIYISNLIYLEGMKYLNTSSVYKINMSTIMLTILLTITLYIVSSFYYGYKNSKSSKINQSIDIGIEKKLQIKPLFLVLFISLLIYVLLNLPLSTNIFGYSLPLLKTVISIILIFSLSFFLIGLLILIFKHSTYHKRFYLHLKTLISKKAFYQYISVMLVCFISIFMIVHTNDYMKTRISSFQEEYKIDYVLTNFITRYEETYIDVQNIDSVDTVSKAGFYQDVDFGHETDKLQTVVSMNSNDIKQFFSLDIDQHSIDLLSQSDNLVVILPQKYKHIYFVDIGDEIYLTFSPTKENIPFVVGGFFEKQLSNQAFINMHLVDDYTDSTYNALFINEVSNSESLKIELLNRYGQHMVYLIDFNEIVSNKIFEMVQTTSYITLILTAIVFCFILAIVNHSQLLLGQMESVYAKLYVVGLSKKGIQLYLIKESIFLFIILLFVSTIGYLLIASQLKDILIFLGEYENVQVYMTSIWKSSIILLFVYLPTKIFYLNGINRIDLSNVLKYY